MSEHHAISPSALEYYSRCAHYMKSDAPSDAAERGTRMHKAVEENRPEMIADEEDRNEVLRTLLFKQTLLAEHPDYTLINEAKIHGTLNFGTADALMLSSDGTRAILHDSKFGKVPVQGPGENLQMKNYAAILFDMYPQLREVECYITQYACHELPLMHVFRKEEMGPHLQEIDAVIQRRRNKDQYPPTPDYVVCQYCQRKAECSAWSGIVTTTSRSAFALPTPDSFLVGIQYADPAQAVAVYLLAGMLGGDEGWCKQVKKAIVTRATSDPEFMASLEANGLKFTSRAGNWVVKDQVGLKAHLNEQGWNDSDILACAKVNAKKLAERAADSNSMVDAAQFLSELPGVEQGDRVQYFRRVSRASPAEQMKELMS